MLALKQTFKWMTYILVLLLTLITLVVFAVTLFIFPKIDDYKDDISNKIAAKIGQKVTIGQIVTDWEGISPKIIIKSMDVYDAQNQSALHLENIHGTFSWLSIPLMHLHLSELSVDKPKLHIQRKESGKLFVAGIPMIGNGKPTLANWLLKQASVEIKNASIIWQDDSRQAPPLSLNQFNFTLSNPAWRQIIGQHQFKLSAIPSVGTPNAINMRGNFYGKDLSKLNNWRGNVKLLASKIDLSIWKPWLDYPIDIISGSGNTELTFGFEKAHINQLIADVELKQLSTKIVEDKPPFEASTVSGLVTWEKSSSKTTITAQKLSLDHQEKQYLTNGTGVIYQTTQNATDWIKASFNAEHIDLALLEKVNASIALPKTVSQQLTSLAPNGILKQIKASFEGNKETVKHYKIDTQFNHINLKAAANIPGVSNISGELDANDENGRIILNTKDAQLDLKQVFRWPIPVNTLDGTITWRKVDNKLKILANDIKLANQHIKGSVNANYQLSNDHNSYLDLNASFYNGDAQYASFYYPHSLNEHAKNWLDKAIVSGKIDDIQVKIKGNLKDFPFIDKQNKPNPKLGTFKVTARLDDSQLKFGNDWPQIDNLGLDLLFAGNSMELNADKGNILGINIKKSKATIPVLSTKPHGKQILNITGEAATRIAEGVKFINASPVKKVTLGFTDDLETDGKGLLNLDLTIPLNDIKSTRFKGRFYTDDGTIYTNARMGIPEINAIQGSILFDESSLNASNIQATIIGGPVTFNIATETDKSININAKGTASDVGIQTAFPNIVSNHLLGNAAWSADILIKQPLLALNITSDLKGMALTLPAPFNKSAEEIANLSVSKKQNQADQDIIEISYNQQLAAKIRRIDQNGKLEIDRGDIAINQAAILPDQPGLYVRGKFDYLNADNWLAILDNDHMKQQQGQLALNAIDLNIHNLDIFSRSISDLSIKAIPQKESFNLLVKSQELEGNIQWYSPTANASNGRIVAQLNKLHIPSNNDNKPTEDEEIEQLKKQYPALDLRVDDFKLGTKALGALEINAYQDNESWVIQQLTISSEDAVLSADGTWHNWTSNPHTNLKFSLSANNIGGTLTRFGQPNTVKGGIALIVGQLAWPGSPHQFKKAGLNGEFTLGASKGQVLKVQPGVGRLLGLLTLQSLPRRLTLDFRDLFSEGFAFDEISASATVDNGILHSDDFHMTGPAAETDIKGDINLNEETQNLHVRVEPHVSDTLSLAALAGGPIAGVAAFVAQKILKDPLNKIAQSEYVIVGTWDNPVEKDAPNKKQEREKSPLNAQHH